jgi:hypothetical protein
VVVVGANNSTLLFQKKKKDRMENFNKCYSIRKKLLREMKAMKKHKETLIWYEV